MDKRISEMWMTTYRNSANARHLLSSQKAGIITDKDMLRRFWKDFFIHYYTGDPYDENYCLIRFSTQKAKLWIDGKHPVITF